MMSLVLGAFIIFVLYVIIWCIRNDGAASIGDQTGFIRMRDPSRSGARKPAAAQHRSHQAAPRPPSGPARRR